MLASDRSTRDHVFKVDKSEAPRAPVSRFYSRQFSRRYFGGDWKTGKCLLSRLSLCGDGVTQAAKRRRWERIEEDRMRRDREANWRAKTSGHNIVRRGRFMLD